MIKRLPMIFFILTILSLIYMIIIRLSAMGDRLLVISSSSGRFIARNYHASVILFLVVLILFIAVTFVVSRIRKKQALERKNADPANYMMSEVEEHGEKISQFM